MDNKHQNLYDDIADRCAELKELEALCRNSKSAQEILDGVEYGTAEHRFADSYFANDTDDYSSMVESTKYIAGNMLATIFTLLKRYKCVINYADDTYKYLKSIKDLKNPEMLKFIKDYEEDHKNE